MIADGAASGDVLRLILRDGSRLIAWAVGLGLGAALLTTRMLRGLLLDVSPLDSLMFVAVTLVLGGVGFAPCYLPARRAAALDPWSALR